MMQRYFSTTTTLFKRAPISMKIPKSTKEISDVPAFLNHIGRQCSEFHEAFPNWDALFTSTSKDMKAAGIDAKPRKYILDQVERYRKASFISNIPVNEATKEIKLHPKKNGGERKLNQYMAKKRILERIELAKTLKQHRKSNKALQLKYKYFDKLHVEQNHIL
jgi:hypothetical protein